MQIQSESGRNKGQLGTLVTGNERWATINHTNELETTYGTAITQIT